jgi:farnesyl diphosphate synthase
LSFEDTLATVAEETERLLGQLLPSDGAAAPRLIAAMRHGALGGGKRLRPLLVTASAGLFEIPQPTALRVGAALECVHCYSLVHDDLPAIDNDDLRRGRPTVHRAFDEATAILAGDSLLTLAFEILAGLDASPRVTVQLVGALARASGAAGMAGGQMLDIEAETRIKSNISDLMLIQNLKTGALFRFACESGAILAEGDSGPLRRYADNIGLAFQITDDILDVESTPAALGKATQKDKEMGKATLVDLLGPDEARKKAEKLVAAAIAELDGYGSRAEVLRDAARFIVARRK